MATKMTATEITERINKAQEAVRKLEALIAKREKELPKAEKALAKLDKETQWGEWFDASYKVRTLRDGIVGGKQKLADKTSTLKRWQAKLDEVNAENKKLDEIPEQLKKLQAELATKIKNYHMRRRAFLRDKYSELGWTEFKEQYGWREYDYYLTRGEKDFEQMATKDAYAEAKYWVLNLIYRTEKKVGQITNWHLYFATDSLNGWVEGTKGNANIETITAGGWNIQCLHTRVLVK